MEIKTKTTVTLNEEEILKILGCSFTSYGYKSVRELDQSGFSNIWINYFFKQETQEKISPQDAIITIFEYLEKEGVSINKYASKFKPSHYWGSEDNEGYRPSCWNVSFYGYIK